MRYLFRNLHIFVFVSFSVFSALFVANEPERTVHLVRPLVEDAVELKELAVGAYKEVRQVNLLDAADEVVSLYAKTLRMPTLLFEGLAKRLDEVERKMSRQRRAQAPGMEDEARRKLSVLRISVTFTRPARPGHWNPAVALPKV
ncbi:hypothetical protein CLV41_11174 [Roseibium marinum]|uniref:Uncharacterized protein n=2 Tax=Roseibium marinum TaxID=281252 RepID=A0A2S3UMA0_9HYPH|nr:hypothetical protein CLV41_11174 [Roseibium marinum]